MKQRESLNRSPLQAPTPALDGQVLDVLDR